MNQPQLGSFESIAIAAIRPSTTNPRKHFDQVALDELTRSIEEMGVTQPLLLRPLSLWHIDGEQEADGAWKLTDGNRKIIHFSGSRVEAEDRVTELNDQSQVYEIVSGERRFRAAQMARLKAVPAIVQYLKDAEALDIQMIENLQRQDLHPVEEADGYRALMATGASVEDVAKKAGKTLNYVKQRIALQTLEVDAKKLFADGHLSLDHALLLARLTPKDQIAALLWLLEIPDWKHKELPPSERIAAFVEDKLQVPTYYRGRSDITPEKHAELVAEYKSARLVDATAAKLKGWISSHVLMLLAKAPWNLDDAELLPVAGPCTTCPKRTGANAALFADLTAAEDVCADPACYAAKQQAFAARELERAKKAGTPLLKLSSKRSHDKLAEPAVKLVPSKVVEEGGKAVQTKRPEVVTKKAVKEGQWVPSTQGACPYTVQGVVADGEDRGSVKFVCPDQSCKVHKHQVERPRTSPVGPSAAEAKQAAEREFNEKVKEAVDAALLVEIEAADPAPARMLEFFLGWYVHNGWNGEVTKLCEALKIAVPAVPKQRTTWETDRRQEKEADKAFAGYLATCTQPELHEVALALLLSEAGESWRQDGVTLASLAARMGIDADAIAKKIRAKAEADRKASMPEEPTKAAAKSAAKKSSAPKRDFKKAAAGDEADELVEA